MGEISRKPEFQEIPPHDAIEKTEEKPKGHIRKHAARRAEIEAIIAKSRTDVASSKGIESDVTQIRGESLKIIESLLKKKETIKLTKREIKDARDIFQKPVVSEVEKRAAAKTLKNAEKLLAGLKNQIEDIGGKPVFIVNNDRDQKTFYVTKSHLSIHPDACNDLLQKHGDIPIQVIDEEEHAQCVGILNEINDEIDDLQTMVHKFRSLIGVIDIEKHEEEQSEKTVHETAKIITHTFSSKHKTHKRERGKEKEPEWKRADTFKEQTVKHTHQQQMLASQRAKEKKFQIEEALEKKHDKELYKDIELQERKGEETKFEKRKKDDV